MKYFELVIELSSSTISTEDFDVLQETAIALTKQCENLINDIDHSSSTSFDQCNDNTIKLPFVTHVNCIHLYQKSERFCFNSTSKSSSSDSLAELENVPLVAINLPLLILHEIDDLQHKITDGDTILNENESQSAMSAILSNVLSKIHPSLTYLEPCGLLRSIPVNGHDSTVLQSQISCDILLLKLNNFQNEGHGHAHVHQQSTMKSTGESTIETQSSSNDNENDIKNRDASIQELSRIIEEVNGESMVASPTSVIQAIPISKITFICGKISSSNKNSPNLASSELEIESKKIPHHEIYSCNTSLMKSNESDDINSQKCEIPICPVCRFRIEPRRFGLAPPKPHQRCSHASAHFDYFESKQQDYCNKMRFLAPWKYPSYCQACYILGERLTLSGAQPFLWDDSIDVLSNDSMSNNYANHKNDSQIISCFKCNMRETLWVCLSCGVVGCGRYSHGHAEQHYLETSHPFSLELATQRIWDYATGSFIQRDDLLNCTYMQQILGAVNRAAYQGASSFCDYQCGNDLIMSTPSQWENGAPPKKAVMIGEEYEALLHSALEDQAQHYNLEIAHLKAKLASETIYKKKISLEEMMVVEALEEEISKLRIEVEHEGRVLIDAHAQEAGHRAKSNSLLREQGVAKKLIDTLTEQAAQEQETNQKAIEELEQQISDLTANLSMREQIAGHQELNNAQIYGTAGSQKPNKKKGYRRSRR